MKKKVNEADARGRILAAATDVFASIGYEGARVDDIAARAGINKAMLYYHVGDKERLYATVLVDTIANVQESLLAAVAQAETPEEKLKCVFDTFAGFGTEHPQFIPIMLREVASGGAALPDEMLLRMAGVFRIVSDVLADGRASKVFRPTDPLLTHVSLVGSMMFLVASQPIRARLSKVAGVEHTHTLDDLARHTANLFLHGLSVAPPPGKKKAPAKPPAKPASKAARSKK
ncbi:MAG TPA: TetR/AcrR family transcriptional regulator [Thermoanaerobaculia bacterium]|nr:TetR/AcrR family transcriptional regulator [Thermoanaerobaculia bacterium]